MSTALSGTGDHWVYRWMDEFEVVDGPSACKRLGSPKSVTRLVEILEAYESSHLPVLRHPSSRGLPGGVAIGGVGIDIGEGTHCESVRCLTSMIDRELGQVLHFFDYVAMEGPPADVWIDRLSQRRVTQSTYDDLFNAVAVMAHLRAVGAAQYVLFIDKPVVCAECAVDDGLVSLPDHTNIEDLARRIVSQRGVSITGTPGLWHATFTHPLLAHYPGISWGGSKRPSRLTAARSAIMNSIRATVSNINVAQELRAPLFSVADPEFFAVRTPEVGPLIDEVAIRLAIPVLSGISTKELVLLREDDYDSFERFRLSLKSAIQMAIDKQGNKSPEEVAEIVQREFLDHGLAAIDAKLRASRTALVRKATAGVAIGTVMAAIGAITQVPLLLTSGLGVAATPLAEVYKYFDSKKEIELSDLYFLWRAARRVGH